MERLPSLERAIAFCAALTGEDAALGRLSVASEQRCRAALERLRAAPRADRAAALAREAQNLSATLPAGLERVHPSWIAAALAGEPPPVVAILLGEAPATLAAAVRAYLPATQAPGQRAPEPDRAVRAWLRRRTLGQLAPMTLPPGTPAELVALFDLSAEALVARLGELGHAELGTRAARTFASLTARPDPVVMRLAAGRLRAAFAAAERADLPRRLAQRLPIALGRAFLEVFEG
jgi:hypothetical protein